jgi:hypothetical protein
MQRTTCNGPPADSFHLETVIARRFRFGDKVPAELESRNARREARLRRRPPVSVTEPAPFRATVVKVKRRIEGGDRR